mgnify:CR=1 FL=1
MKNVKNVLLVLCLMSVVFVIVGCKKKTGDAPKTGKSTMEEMTLTEKNHQRLRKANPEPKLDSSLERANLIKYLDYWNNPNRASYIYLLSRSGTVLSHYVIKGKVTYCRSKLTTRDQLVEAPFYDDDNGAGGNLTSSIESPGLDGTYGPSEDAIFFFTTENPDVPVVWKGDYLVSGVPMSLTTQPILFRTIVEK